MARPTSVTVSSATSSAWIPVDWRSTPFNLSFAVIISGGGSLTYKVEHTLDDIMDPTVTPNALTHEFITASTVSDDGNYAYPIRAIRLTVSSYTSGSATMTVIQPGAR